MGNIPSGSCGWSAWSPACPNWLAAAPDDAAITAAAAFANVGWAIQVRQGQIDAWQILNRPTNDIQRELAIGALQDSADDLDADSIELAAETLRHCNDRYTDLPEARALAEAENLADIGLPYVLRQFRRYQAEGRGVDELLASWNRQCEYQYWDARINDGLRFATSRQVARTRLEAVDRFMSALGEQTHAEDVYAALQQDGIEVPVIDLDFD